MRRARPIRGGRFPGATGTMVWMDPQTQGFCILLTSAVRARAPWRLVHLSNAVAAAFV